MNEVYIMRNDFEETKSIKRLFENKDYMSIEDLISAYEDLLSDYEDLEEKHEDLEQDLQDNYVHRPMSDYTGDSYDDRF